MTRDQLEHAVRAACDAGRVSDVIVIGSQAILGAHPEAPARLRQSLEVDLVFDDPNVADAVEGALGESSLFHANHGFYAQGLTLEGPDGGPCLPEGWRGRLVLVRNANTRRCSGWCLEPHDLAASKLAAFRDKDREFVRGMLYERLIDARVLGERLATMPVDGELRARLLTWVTGTVRDLAMPATPTSHDAG